MPTQRPGTTAIALLAAAMFFGLAMSAGAPPARGLSYSWGVALGGSGGDGAWCSAIDSSGNFIAAGGTGSSDFPVVNGFLGNGFTRGNGFIAKFSPSGSVVWSVVLGGTHWPGSCGNIWVACDGLGNVYCACSNGSICVVKITPDGQLEWSTSFGIGNVDCLVVDSRGIPYVSGTTTDSNFPVTIGPPAKVGARTCFVTALAPASGDIVWSMCLGGSGEQYPHALRVDPNDDLVMVGTTNAQDFPTTDGSSKFVDGVDDFFFAKIRASDGGPGAEPGTVCWSTLIGGHGNESGGSLEVDTHGNVLFCGVTASLDFPDRNGATVGDFLLKLTADGVLSWVRFRVPGHPCYGVVHHDADDNIYASSGESGGGGASPGATKFSPDGDILWRCPFAGMDFQNDVTVDTDGGLILFGWTDSPTATVVDAFQPVFGGQRDVYVIKITGQGSIAWASYLGGPLDEGSTHVAVNGHGGIFLYGGSAANNPFFPPALPDMRRGGSDIFVAMVSELVITGVLPDGQVGAGYSGTLTAVGGAAPFTWSIDTGALPPGLTLDGSTGLISGTPTLAGTFYFTARVTDSLRTFATKLLTITISPDKTWLAIDKLQIGLPPKTGCDTLLLQGSFNMPSNGNAPETVTLTIDGWSVVMTRVFWDRVGKSNVYACKKGDVVGKMTYWVKGSSKCLFTFTASKQTLKDLLLHYPDLPVRLQLGGDFDETLTATVRIKSQVARLSSVGPLPIFWIDKIAVTRNLRQPCRDALNFSGRLFLARDFDPASNAIIMSIGPYAFTLPLGGMSESPDGVFKYTIPTGPKGKLTVRLSLKTHTLAVTATEIDLSSLTQDTHVSLTITDQAGADWSYGIFLAVNKKGTAFTY